MTLHLLVSCIFDFVVFFIIILLFTYLYTACILHIFGNSHCRRVTPITTVTIFISILRHMKWQMLSFYLLVLSCCMCACTHSSRVAMKLAFVYYWVHFPVQVCSSQELGTSRRGPLGAYCLDEWLSDRIRTSALMRGNGNIRPRDKQSRHVTACQIPKLNQKKHLSCCLHSLMIL